MSIVEYKLTTIESSKYDKMYSTVYNNDFTDWLEEQLKTRGWTQADLAREAGVSRGAIGNVLRGDRQPGPELLTAIAAALRLPPVSVFIKAGLLPPEPAKDPLIENVIHLMAQMDDVDREEMVALAEAKLNFRRQRDMVADFSDRLSSLTPEEAAEQLRRLVVQWGITDGRPRRRD